MHAGPEILAYLGPESMMPAASLLAAIVGLLLLGWRTCTAFAAKCARHILSRKWRVESTLSGGNGPEK